MAITQQSKPVLRKPIILLVVLIVAGLPLTSVAALLITNSGSGNQEDQNQNYQIITKTGTVIYLKFEGGFFGLLTDDGYAYDPINLDESFQVEGLRVAFQARVLYDHASFHMWAPLIEIIWITLLY